MSLSLKPGVKLPAMLAMSFAITTIYDAFKEAGYDCTITAGLDGKHSAGSKHYVGLALDFRSRNIPASEREPLRNKIASRLGADFDVILEKDHLHVELDPKTPIGATA